MTIIVASVACGRHSELECDPCVDAMVDEGGAPAAPVCGLDGTRCTPGSVCLCASCQSEFVCGYGSQGPVIDCSSICTGSFECPPCPPCPPGMVSPGGCDSCECVPPGFYGSSGGLAGPTIYGDASTSLDSATDAINEMLRTSGDSCGGSNGASCTGDSSNDEVDAY